MEIHNSFKAMIMDGMPKDMTPPVLPKAPVHQHTYKENMCRVLEHQKPYWIPVASENNLMIPDVVLERPAMNKGGKDWFGVEWQYAESVHAPSIKPGFILFEEIEDWEESVQFPDLDSIDWESNAKLVEKEFLPDRNNNFVLFNGCFERLHSMMGFENALCGMLLDPESCRALFDAIADFKIRLIDKLISYYPVDTIVYHDDWGTNDNTFFSLELFEELLYEPTKKIVDYVHSRGKYFTLHCCGRVEKLVPYMIKMGVDSWESAQMDINDLPAIRKRYGNKISMECVMVDPVLMDPCAGEAAVRSKVRELIMPLAKDGPLIITRLNRCAPENMYWVYDEFYKISESVYKD